VDELARRYLLLALRLDRLSPGFVDSYVGPPELAEIARGEPEPLVEEVHAEALALRDLAESMDGDGPGIAERRAWFLGQLRAMSALARRAGGEEIAYLDLVEELFGIPIRRVPDNDLALARDRIESALDGPGSLHQRLAALRARLRIAPDMVLPAVQASTARFRTASRRDLVLPPEESIDWQAAHDQPWAAYAGFLGQGRSRIRINLDLPIEATVIAVWASHEAYPGHHAEHVVKEQTLIVSADLGEATLRTMNTPEAVLSEGLADVGREVVMTDVEHADELRRIGEMVGVKADWAAAATVRRALNELQAATANAAILLHHDGRPEREVREYLLEVGATAPERLDHSMRVLNDPVNKTYVFTYTEGARLIRPWLEVEGQTVGFQRLLSAQLSPAILLADLEAAGMPTGASD
jgi:hypothetical protein